MGRSCDEEFAAFAAASIPHLRRTAYLICGNWHHAEVVAQKIEWLASGTTDNGNPNTLELFGQAVGC